MTKKSSEENGKSRIKERTIEEVIQKVSLWRLLYTGYQKNGVTVKMSLEEAAQKVKISKKSLDDYLMQLRSAKKFGFDFDANIREKVGKIRSFVRQKKEEERQRLALLGQGKQKRLKQAITIPSGCRNYSSGEDSSEAKNGLRKKPK